MAEDVGYSCMYNNYFLDWTHTCEFHPPFAVVLLNLYKLRPDALKVHQTSRELSLIAH